MQGLDSVAHLLDSLYERTYYQRSLPRILTLGQLEGDHGWQPKIDAPTNKKRPYKQIEFGKIRILFAEYGRIALKKTLVRAMGALEWCVPRRCFIQSVCRLTAKRNRLFRAAP